MKTVAIICEYNPFHNGHQYHIEKIKKEFGEDTAVLALMSGNYVQRGECAIADKALRARCALEAGVNLVLELPFPFSCSSAEIFAFSAVSILNSLGTVDYLSFGSEAANLASLTQCAEVMLSPEFDTLIAELSHSEKCKSSGYPAICEAALSSLCKSDVSLTPNNILAIEYIKALKRTKSKITPHTIQRIGAGYNEKKIVNTELQSASAIRASVHEGDISALEYTPKNAKKLILSAIAEGSFPCNSEKLSTALISHFRISSPEQKKNIFDCTGGLDNRLFTASQKANTLSQFIRLSETKKYTTARIRRAIWYSFFGVTSSDVKISPMYSQLLATDDVGRQILRKIKKHGAISILTKPSDTASLSDAALSQKTLCDKADSIFQLTKPTPPSGAYALKFTPYVKK